MIHIRDPIYRNMPGFIVFIKYLYFMPRTILKGNIHYIYVTPIATLWDKCSYFYFLDENIEVQSFGEIAEI